MSSLMCYSHRCMACHLPDGSNTTTEKNVLPSLLHRSLVPIRTTLNDSVLILHFVHRWKELSFTSIEYYYFIPQQTNYFNSKLTLCYSIPSQVLDGVLMWVLYISTHVEGDWYRCNNFSPFYSETHQYQITFAHLHSLPNSYRHKCMLYYTGSQWDCPNKKDTLRWCVSFQNNKINI